MAYATGTGTGQQDFLDALRSFASGLGWTINRWDTTNKLLYLSKDACKVVLEWLNANISVYNNSTTSTMFSEGRIRGSLVSAITDSSTQYWTFPGFACLATTLARDNGGQVYSCNLQGAFVGWHLFSNATGDYIHAMIEVTAGVYTFLGFGNADKNGLSHSGAAYLFGDGLRYWYDTDSNAQPSTNFNYHYFNKPSRTGSAFAGCSGARSPAASLHILTVDALPAGFVNNQAIANFATSSTSYTPTTARAMSLRKTQASSSSSSSSSSSYISSFESNEGLADFLTMASSPDYSSYVPLIGIPLVVTNIALTQACAVGSVPDLRLVNMRNMSPQQEISLGDDTWKVFPQLRLADWLNGLTELMPSSGYYGLAFKKI